ncbi:hypothetical protein SY88_00210 [Clostridiales bacterium PH28_bin88]|nr:hypothetical protein SY88_00210 [Clostridiales bacterium PH28_bin88]
MSAYAIVGREAAQAVAACLRRRGKGEAPLRIAEGGKGALALEEAARVPADLLFLDIDTGPGLGPAVLRYRLARPNVRIVLLAPGRVPGDPEVAGIVQAGVYDVVTDLEELESVMDRPAAKLASAALWLDPSLASGASRREQLRERVVERRVAVSQRPVLIAVAGVAPGVGTTTVACTLAGYLARQGYRTVLVEAGEHPSLGFITEMDLDQNPAGWLPNLDVCADPAPRNLVRARQHAYVVADLGAYPRAELDRLDADLIMVVLPQAHRIQRAVAWLRAGNLPPVAPERVRYVMMGEKEAGRQVAAAWEAICAEMAAIQGEGSNLAVYLLPAGSDKETWPPGYRHRSDELDRACAGILAEVLPDPPGRRGWPWHLLGKWKGQGGKGTATSGRRPGFEGAPR